MKNYLIASESYHVINEEVNKIASDFSNILKYDLRTNALNEVLSEASYSSLIGEKKLIIFRCDDLFKSKKNEEENTDNKKDDILEKYLYNPCPDTSIIFTTSVIPDKRKRLFKLFSKMETAFIYSTFNKKELCYKCIDILKEKGYYINYDTANFIVENSYNNYDILLNELEKIYALINDKNLNIELISNIISKSYNNTTYSFINALLEKDLKKAIHTSENFEILKIEGIVILIMLYKEYEIIKLLLEGNNPREIQYLFKKEDWQMNNYMNLKSKFTLNEIKKIIVKLNDYDFKFKSGLISTDLLVDLITIDFCE